MGLKDKASKIDFGSLPGVTPVPVATPAVAAGPRPKTAPGLMMAQASDQRSELLRDNEELKQRVEALSVVAARVEELQDELKGWDGARATRLIDPRLIVRSAWANRDPRHFESADFEALKAEIAHAGGNVQPIKVRPVASATQDQFQYELVFGHRRHEACRQLGLPVLALVENLGDTALFVEMDRENRSRKDLSAWEQGVMYQRALQQGLFPSNRKLAKAVGADLSNVGKALALAALPEAVVSAFVSPLDLQFRWAKPLRDAWEYDQAGVLARAKALAALPSRPEARVVFERLVSTSGTVPRPPVMHEVSVGERRVAVLSVNGRNQANIAFETGVIQEDKLAGLAQAIADFVAKHSEAKR